MGGLKTAFDKIPADEKKQMFQKLMREVQENLDSIPSGKTLAMRTGMSENLCELLFQEYLKTSPTKYIRGYRLEKACQMLTQTYKPMAEISALCGMNNSYFSKTIREATGLTPMEYRRNHRRSNSTQK